MEAIAILSAYAYATMTAPDFHADLATVGQALDAHDYGSLGLYTAALATPFISATMMSKVDDVLKATAKPLKNITNKARYKYDAVVGRYRNLKSGQFVKKKNLPWPKNEGFAEFERGTVKPSSVLDRYGSASGYTTSTPGTSISQRGLPPGSEALEHIQYDVLEPIKNAKIGTSASVPEFGAEGGGSQFTFMETLEELERLGKIRRKQ